MNEFKSNWITERIDEEGIGYLEKLGEYLADKRPEGDRTPSSGMTTSQIRNIYGEIKRIQAQGEDANWQNDFLLLRPKIAYNTARVLNQKKGNRIKAFHDVIEKAHREVDDKFENFIRFTQFVEAIIAYHKYYGGKD